MVIPNALLIVNGKGGVAKTSVTANLAAGAASAGWRVLAVDLDPQGNLARDLGYLDRSDGGRSLLAALLTGAPPDVIASVRPGLDVVAAGPHTAQVADHLALVAARGRTEATAELGACLEPLADAYDLVIVDMPPGDSAMQRAAAEFGRFVVCPTTADDAGLDGIGRVFDTLRQVSNDQLEILGVVITLASSSATAVVRRAREELRTMLGVAVPVFDATVRYALAAAVACRSKGLTAAEYEGRAANAKPWYRAKADGEEVERYSSAASSLAGDYERLANEVLRAVTTSIAENSEVVLA